MKVFIVLVALFCAAFAQPAEVANPTNVDHVVLVGPEGTTRFEPSQLVIAPNAVVEFRITTPNFHAVKSIEGVAGCSFTDVIDSCSNDVCCNVEGSNIFVVFGSEIGSFAFAHPLFCDEGMRLEVQVVQPDGTFTENQPSRCDDIVVEVAPSGSAIVQPPYLFTDPGPDFAAEGRGFYFCFNEDNLFIEQVTASGSNTPVAGGIKTGTTPSDTACFLLDSSELTETGDYHFRVGGSLTPFFFDLYVRQPFAGATPADQTIDVSLGEFSPQELEVPFLSQAFYTFSCGIGRASRSDGATCDAFCDVEAAFNPANPDQFMLSCPFDFDTGYQAPGRTVQVGMGDTGVVFTRSSTCDATIPQGQGRISIGDPTGENIIYVGGVNGDMNLYEPSAIEVIVGETVTFIWETSSVHTATQVPDEFLPLIPFQPCWGTPPDYSNASFDSGALEEGDTFTVTFNEVGVFTYGSKNFCSLGMHGTVTVITPPTEAPSPAPTTPAPTPPPTPSPTTPSPTPPPTPFVPTPQPFVEPTCPEDDPCPSKKKGTLVNFYFADMLQGHTCETC